MSAPRIGRQGSPERYLRVDSWRAAQELVRFPVFQTAGEPSEISIRPESRTEWSTVRTLHHEGSTVFSVKQYAMDYLGHFGAPNKLYMTKPDRWELYGPTVMLRVASGSAFHGREWDGIEGASLVTHGIHVEVRVLHGRMGAEGSERFLNSLAAVSDASVRKFDHMPLCLWNWTLRRPSNPPTGADQTRHRTRWIVDLGAVRDLIGRGRSFPTIPRWSFDCAGIRRIRGGPLIRFFLRSEDRNTILEGAYSEGCRSSIRGALWPHPPLFKELAKPALQVWGMRSPMMRWAHYLVSEPNRHLAIVIPPGSSISKKDRQLVQLLRDYFRGSDRRSRPRDS